MCTQKENENREVNIRNLILVRSLDDKYLTGPIQPYEKSYPDRPTTYCCEALKYRVEDDKLGYIQYDSWLKEFLIVHPTGFPVGWLTYCPWCGAEIRSLRWLYYKKAKEYVGEEIIDDIDEFQEHWPIISQCFDQETTMRLIAEVKAKKQGS